MKNEYTLKDEIEPVPYRVVGETPLQEGEFPVLYTIPDEFTTEESSSTQAERNSSPQADGAHAVAGEILQAEEMEEALPIWIRATQKRRIPSTFHTPRYKQQQS